jgi:carbon-monoxide dehydrogenase small subunit
LSPERYQLAFSCNGDRQTLEVRAERLLIDVLREDLGLTGTKLGCGTGDCGACTVLLDGKPVNACLVYALECDGSAVQTVEELARSVTGRVLVDALIKSGAVQCGICTPGFLVSACALLEQTDRAVSRKEIEVSLAGNLCRCTGYLAIVQSIASASRDLFGNRSPIGELVAEESCAGNADGTT